MKEQGEDLRVRPLKRDELEDALAVIHESFRTVAGEFGLTRENCPKHTSFIPLSFLETQMKWGWQMYGLFAGDQMVGYMSVSKWNTASCKKFPGRESSAREFLDVKYVQWILRW